MRYLCDFPARQLEVLATLWDVESATVAEIRDALLEWDISLSASTIYTHLERLMRRGAVERIGMGREAARYRARFTLEDARVDFTDRMCWLLFHFSELDLLDYVRQRFDPPTTPASPSPASGPQAA